MSHHQPSDVELHPDAWAWVPDRSWRTPSHLVLCKRHCGTPPVAERDTYTETGQRRGPRWYAFCEPCMAPYHRLRDGVVEVAVRPDSPAGRRGWTD